MKVAVIGAGASGIIASIVAKRENSNIQVDIFDKNISIGKKILASGNGRCNISNKNISYSDYFGENIDFIKYSLKEFDFNNFKKFFETLGLIVDIKESGKVYPLSNDAKSVVNLLNSQLNYLNVNIFCETEIIKIEKKGDIFSICTEDKVFKNYDKVLISSGLGAYPQLKSSEDGLNFAKSFGHKINQTYPSLVGLTVDDSFCKNLQGLKKEANVTLYVNNKKEEEFFGDVLFTSYGVSGFAILDISQKASYNLVQNQKIHLAIDFFPNIQREELSLVIENILKVQKDELVLVLLQGIIPLKLAKEILKICNIEKEIKADSFSIKHIKTIVNSLKNLKLQINGTQGFKHSEVSGGGVRVDEVDFKTYESKICKNIYFSGEVLDIVGKRGGYNLHFAFASGYLAGKSLAKKRDL